MVVFTAMVGGLLFSVLVYALVFYLLHKRRKLKLLEWFLLSVATFNGIGFGFVIWATFNGRNPFFGTQKLMQFDIYTISTFLLSNIVLIGSVIIGWCLAPSFKEIFKLGSSKRAVSILSQKNKKINYVACFILLVAIISYWLYVKPYGGFVGLLDHSRAIRAGVSTIRNPLSFLKIFGSLSFLSSFLFFGILLEKKHSNKLTYIGFIISLLFSIYVLYSWMGRSSLAVYLLTFILGYIIYNYTSVISFLKRVMFFVISGFFLVTITDVVLGDSKYGFVGMMSKELSFPFMSYITQISNSDYRWFQDLIVAPLYLLPKSIWANMLNIETATSYNTLIVAGARKGEGVSGSLPIDFITLGHIQASIFGILVIGVLWGLFLHAIEDLLSKFKSHGLYAIVYANVVLNVVVLNTLYADPNHLLSRNFPLIVGALIFWFFGKFTLNKRQSQGVSINA